MSNNSEQHDSSDNRSPSLSDAEKHDLNAALLSIKWAADLLEPADGSAPPCALIAAQLRQSYANLANFISPFLDSNGKHSS